MSTEEKTYGIIVVDDHRLFADGLERILEDERDFKILGNCNGGVALHHLLNNHTPHLIMLDIQMAGKNGLELCTQLKSERPEVKIILISMFESANVISEGRKAGADGFIPKTTDAVLLKKTIRDVLKDKKVFIKPDKPTETMAQPGAGQQFLISRREKDIIKLVKKGYTSRMMAEELNISQYTVETHRKNILKKLHLNSIKELISYAYEHNLG